MLDKFFLKYEGDYIGPLPQKTTAVKKPNKNLYITIC